MSTMNKQKTLLRPTCIYEYWSINESVWYERWCFEEGYKEIYESLDDEDFMEQHDIWIENQKLLGRLDYSSDGDTQLEINWDQVIATRNKTNRKRKYHEVY